MNKPADLQLITETELAVKWGDGHESFYNARHLRENCPCAGCVNEMTGKRILTPATIPADIAIVEISSVGHYGNRIQFTDRHSTGIYSFDYLRKICSCEKCRRP